MAYARNAYNPNNLFDRQPHGIDYQCNVNFRHDGSLNHCDHRHRCRCHRYQCPGSNLSLIHPLNQVVIQQCSSLAVWPLLTLSCNDVCMDADGVHHNHQYHVTMHHVSMCCSAIVSTIPLHLDTICPIIDLPVHQSHTTIFNKW